VPVMEVRETDYRDAQSVEDLRELRKTKALAIALETAVAAAVVEEEQEIQEGESGNLPFVAVPLPAENAAPIKIALSAEPGKALVSSLNGGDLSTELKRLLGDPNIPKAVHEYKVAIRELGPRGIELAGVRDEPA